MPTPPAPDSPSWDELIQALRAAIQQRADRAVLLAALDRLEQVTPSPKPEEMCRTEPAFQLLYALACDVSLNMDWNHILDKSLKTMVQLTGAERGIAITVDDSGTLHPRLIHDTAPLSSKSKGLSFSQSIVQEALHQAHSIITVDAQSDPRFSGRESVIWQGLHSVLCIPLIALGRPLGVIYLEHHKPAAFSQADLPTLTMAADWVALVLTHAEKYQLLQQRLNARTRDLHFLLEMQQALGEDHNYTRILEQGLSWAIRAVGAASGALGLLEASGLRWRSQQGSIVCSLEAAQQVLHHQRPRLEAQQVLLPLVHTNRPIGVLVLQAGGGGFSEGQWAIARLVAGLIAHYLESARMYDDLRQAQQRQWALIEHLLQGYEPALQALEAGDPRAPFLLRRIWDNQRAFALLEQGCFPLALLPIKLRPPLETALETCRTDMQQKQIHLDLELPDGLPAVLADSDALSLIFKQLIHNAIAYTPDQGYVHLQVTTLPGTPLMVQCTIEDSGYGISPEDQKRLFTPFFRSQDPRVQAIPGSGLGLAIAKRLVEIHGGQIGFHSQVGQGSTFFFTLPQSDGSDFLQGL